MVDVFQALKLPFVATVPTDCNADENHAFKARLDYVFVTANLVPYIVSASVIKDVLTNKASDHFPLTVDFSFNLK